MPGLRGRGTRAGLTLRQILDAARSIQGSRLTMQAVADQLGVDRKALNHHVIDRQTLVKLLASDVLGAGIPPDDIESAGDWKEACRRFARSLLVAVRSLNERLDDVWFGEPHSIWAAEATEALFAQLLRAGFDDERAVRAITLLSSVCLSHARDVADASAGMNRPRMDALEAALGLMSLDNLSHLHRIASSGVDTYGSDQFEFSVETVIAGLG